MIPSLGRLSVFSSTLLLAGFAVAGGPPVRVDSQGDPLPDGALARIGSVRLRHNGEIGMVAFTPDGKSLLSLGSDNTFRRWDPQTGKEQARFARKGQSLYLTAQMGMRDGFSLPPGGLALPPRGFRGKVDFYLGGGVGLSVAH